MITVVGFDFSADSRSQVLILGSAPGGVSLMKQQYYSDRRNQFWDLMSELFGFACDLPYESRMQRLRDEGVAVWDVIRTCQRKGSLDKNIVNPEPNGFGELFAVAPGLHSVFFNGQKPAQWFEKLVAPSIQHELTLTTLPSTSRAYASMCLADKIAAWMQIKDAMSG